MPTALQEEVEEARETYVSRIILVEDRLYFSRRGYLSNFSF